MATWGETELRIDNTTYRPPEADVRINEIEILPDPATPFVPASVLQQGGTGRKRTSFEGYVKTLAEYEALQTDKLSGTERLFVGLESEELLGIIEALTVVQIYPPRLYRIRYSMTIVES